MKNFTFLLCIICTISAARADIIQPVNVTTNMGTSSSTTDFKITNIIDQSGLSANYTSGVTDDSFTATHFSSFPQTWASSFNTPTGFVSFDLGSSLKLTGLRFWQGPLFVGGQRTDVKDFALYSDTDLDPSNGSGTLLGNFVATDLLNINTPMQEFAFDTTTQFVHLQILSNLGNSPSSSIGEVAFTVSAVPEPSALMMASVGVLGLLVRRRIIPKS